MIERHISSRTLPHDVLSGYEPRTPEEKADLGRILALLSGDSPLPSARFHLTASALVVHPPTRQVLLRWHARERAWLHVGGHAEPGEVDPMAVALREAREETGLTDLRPWPDSRLVHVAVITAEASDSEPAHEHADFRFVFATNAPGSVRPEHPDAVLRWLSVIHAREATTMEDLRETLDRLEMIFEAPRSLTGA
jgi:8-oxo-dGTP pyrophosphatase MutT (NUDIX family)